jgi:hypothetical protein
MQTPYPDYRHYTAREYGLRVGYYRLLDAFAKHGIKASIAANGVVAERYPRLIRDAVAAGHEIIAHSVDMNGAIASGLGEAAERALIRNATSMLQETAGVRPSGWLSIARSQSFNTPRLLVEEGYRYLCDWVNDELPYAMNTEAGAITALPLNHELSDRQIISVQQNSAESYVQQMQDAYSWLSSESARFGGRMLPLHLTPYIIALPYRIAAFEALLGWLSAQDGAWFARGDAILDSAGL